MILMVLAAGEAFIWALTAAAVGSLAVVVGVSLALDRWGSASGRGATGEQRGSDPRAPQAPQAHRDLDRLDQAA